MDKEKFLRLHIHSVHSSRDGMLKISELVKQAKASNEAFSLTDHGSISGWIECIDECKKNNIKPVLGLEAYITNHRDRILELKELISKEKNIDKKRIMQHERDEIKQLFHLVLIAKNQNGFYNIIELNNIGFTEGFYGKPIITYDDLLDIKKKYSLDLIATSACIGSPINQYILNKKYNEAKEWANILKDIFGDDFYLEVQSNNIPEQKIINKKLIDISKELNIKLCIGMDSHYLSHEDVDTHQDLLLLQDKKVKADVGKVDIRITYENKKGETKIKKVEPNIDFRKGIKAKDLKIGDLIKGDKIINLEKVDRVWSFSTDLLYYKSQQQLEKEIKKYHKELVPYIDELINNNKKIYSKIEQIVLDESVKLPEVKDAKKKFIEEIKKGLKAKGLVQKEYIERIKFELNIINQNNFEGYFLILQDMLNYAKKQNIPIGFARGSSTGSLVAYVLDITRVNPLDPRWGPLPFERFLSNERNINKIIIDDGNGNQKEFFETAEVLVKRKNKSMKILAKNIKIGDELL